ncbi:hypothetical protein ACIBG7_15040 [Nonomuraea sp. NPDC050328]|uniref:hypothetical protein n=1 Tax=Nonomuraea sp. NPDC050328 TaxID=3364361 RepID=UPI00378D0469
MASDSSRKSAQMSIASDISWARTANRSERTEPARRASPMHIDYWVAKVRAEGVVREQDVQAAAESYYRAHMRRMSLKAADARRRRSQKPQPEGLRRSA